MIDILIALVVAAVVIAAAAYIRKEKKKGVKCIGCPNGARCSGNCGGCGTEQ